MLIKPSFVRKISTAFQTNARRLSLNYNSSNIPLSLPLFSQNSDLTIRNATLDDVQQINNCNRRNLPENYENFYISEQILTWPLLSLVVVCDKNVVGYVLGKISQVDNLKGNFKDTEQSTSMYSGHITSVAIEESFRRSGVATVLMKAVHQQMCLCPNLQSIDLFCRVSNVAAIQHYTKKHGYKCKYKIASYYADGEDGWLMEWQRDSEKS